MRWTSRLRPILFIATFCFLAPAGARSQDWGYTSSKSSQQTGEDELSKRLPSFSISVRDSGGAPIYGAAATIGELWVEKSDHHGIVRIDSKPGLRFPVSIVVSAPGYQARQLFVSGSRLESPEVHLPRLESNTPDSGNTVSVAELSPENQTTSADLQQKALQALQKGDFSRTEQLLRKAIELTPSVGMLYNNLGVAVLRQGRLQEAIALFERAHKLVPHDAGTNGNLGLLYWMQGRRDESYRLLDRAVGLGFSTQSAHYYLGILALERGQWKLSTEQLSRINGERFRYRDLFLTLALRGIGREKEAQSSFHRYMSRNPVPYYAFIHRYPLLQAAQGSLPSPSEQSANASPAGNLPR